MRLLRDRLLAQFGDPGERDRAAARAAREVALSQPVPTDLQGVWEYVLRVDAEATAILEAAIGPLSAPMHTEQARDQQAMTVLRNRKYDEELQTWMRQIRDEAYVEIKLPGADQAAQ